MRSFLSNAVRSSLLVATLAIGGYFVLAPPAAPAVQPAAIELANSGRLHRSARLGPTVTTTRRPDSALRREPRP